MLTFNICTRDLLAYSPERLNDNLFVDTVLEGLGDDCHHCVVLVGLLHSPQVLLWNE